MTRGRVPWVRMRRHDHLILVGYACGVLGLLAFGVGVFTASLALVGVSVLLAIASFLLLRQGAKRLWR